MRAQNYKEAIKSILWLNWIVGFGIVEIPLNRPWPILSVFYTLVIWIGGYFYNIPNLYVRHIIAEPTRPMYERMTLGFHGVVNAFIMAFYLFISWYYSKNMKNLISRCMITDDTLEGLGVDKNHVETCQRIETKVLAWVVVDILPYAADIYLQFPQSSFDYCLFITVGYYFPSVVILIVDVTFVALIQSMKMRFRELNNLIERVPRDIISLTTIRCLHLELCRLSREINSIFSLQIVLQLIGYFVLVITSMYNTYGKIVQYFIFGKSNPVIEVFLFMFWPIVYIFKLCWINTLCSSTMAEFGKTGKIVQYLSLIESNIQVRREVQQFSLQITLCPLNLTGLRLFLLNDYLSAKFVASLLTNLFLLIQFSTTPKALKILFEEP